MLVAELRKEGKAIYHPTKAGNGYSRALLNDFLAEEQIQKRLRNHRYNEKERNHRYNGKERVRRPRKQRAKSAYAQSFSTNESALVDHSLSVPGKESPNESPNELPQDDSERNNAGHPPGRTIPHLADMQNETGRPLFAKGDVDLWVGTPRNTNGAKSCRPPWPQPGGYNKALRNLVKIVARYTEKAMQERWKESG